MKKLLFILFTLTTINAFADDITTNTNTPSTTPDAAADEILTFDEYFESVQPSDTVCATGVYADALAKSATDDLEMAHETTVRKWIYDTLHNPDTIRAVLACPEIANAEETEQIKFMPIKHIFPGGREITINYETQPKIIRQHLLLANKRTAPTTDPNPKLSSADGTIWTNTDPAWYGIMVVEHGTLNQFVGPDKNNTLSMQYINDNIDTLYPQSRACTSKTAFADDEDAINEAGVKTIGIGEDDSNDYYVAGDANLEWVGYAEIVADVLITVVTFGGGAIVSGATKIAQSMRAIKNLRAGLKTLETSADVVKYIDRSNDAAKIAGEIKALEKINGSVKAVDNTTAIKNIQKNIDDITNQMKRTRNNAERLRLDNQLKTLQKQQNVLRNKKTTQVIDNTDEIAKKRKQLEETQDAIKKLEKTDDVTKYKDMRASHQELVKYVNDLKRLTKPAKQTGNVAARTAKHTFQTIKALKAAFSGGKIIKRGRNLGRASKFSAQAKDWLFHQTLKNLGKLGKLEAQGGILYAAVTVAGDMYDFTETSTGDFTNNIDFKPLLLLSADDIPESENVINYGMWLLWRGHSYSAADDDAAFLQAMDFAAKFHEDLMEVQGDSNSPCNVDIYVVRPIIRNPDADDAQLYYLIMNDQPWTTADI